MDPLSIVTGVGGLLTICYQVGTALKDFYFAIEIVDTKIKGLQGAVKSFVDVLTLTEATLQQDEIKISFSATGHINNLWKHLLSCIKDGQETLSQLRDLLDEVNTKTSVLNGIRKHARLQKAVEEIGVYQQQIQGCKDTLQLSLHAITLWSQATLQENQITLQESTNKILPKLEEVERQLQRMDVTLRRSMTELQRGQSVAESGTSESQSSEGNRNESSKQLRTLTNLIHCIQSAATIVSDASTTLGVGPGRSGSEFGGDYIPSERSEAMKRWISDNPIREEHPDPKTSPHQRRGSTGRETPPISADKEFDDTDCDSETELEEEKVHALIASGKQALKEEGKFRVAENHFFNGLDRIKMQSSKLSPNRISKPKSELINLLLKIYRSQDKLEEAQSHLMDSVRSDPSNLRLLSEMLSLVEALFEKEDYSNALACGGRALRAYRKLGPEGAAGKESTLQLLIKVCKANGNGADQAAFEAMLSHPQSHTESWRDSPTSVDRSLRSDAVLRGTNTSNLSSGESLDLGDKANYITAQSQRSNLWDLRRLTGEEELMRWRGFSSQSVSTTTPRASLFSDDQQSPWSRSSVTTLERTDSIASNYGGRLAGSIENNNYSSRAISSRGYFDAKAQPGNFQVGRRVQSFSSTSSGLGELANIEKFEKEINCSFNTPALLDPPRPTTVPTKLPAAKEYDSETTSDSNWLSSRSEKEVENEKPRQGRASTMTMPRPSILRGPRIKSNIHTPQAEKLYKKVIVVGDHKCGKTPLLTRITEGSFSADAPPTQWELHTVNTEIDSKHIELAIWELGANDKAGFSRLRSSPGPYVFLICFPIDCTDSLAKINIRWVSEVQNFAKNAPYILVGLKSDLRTDPQTVDDLRKIEKSPVTVKQGQVVADMIKAEQYLECSAKTGQGVAEVLEAATRLTLVDPKVWERTRKENEKQQKMDEKKKQADETKAKGGESRESLWKKSLLRNTYNKITT